MLGPGRYLLGALEIAALAGFAGLGGWSVRRRWLPRLEGAPGGLAAAVIALAILVWGAELLGSFGIWTAGAYLVVVTLVGVGMWGLQRGRVWGPRLPTVRQGASIVTVIAIAIALVAIFHFAGGVRTRLSTGMTGFDSTWYHGPFAAGFFQSGDTWGLHFIAPQFLAWFYPANGELFHAVGMLAFGRDLLSPFLNLGWFVGCLVACWCVGRPYRVAPWSLVLGAVALSVPTLADQAGEARNDIVGTFFLLAAVAVALNAAATARADSRDTAELALVGLAAGLAAGTKLNFLLPAAVLVLGLVLISPRGARWRALLAAGLGALAGGGYWYLRNLAHAGNPLPWVHHLGPISLPAPQQALGGREAHSVFGYLGNGGVWSDWFLPGLHHSLWIVWPLLGLAALAGLLLALPSLRCAFAVHGMAKEQRSGRGGAVLGVAGLVGLAAALAWLVAPTSASGPDGIPRGFESGLRYLAPALILGLALLPTAPALRSRLHRIAEPSLAWLSFPPDGGRKDNHARWRFGAALAGIAVVAIAIGYPIQRHYLRDRYANPSFSTPGLDAAFAWARDVSGARIATTSTRQYPLFGTDLSNHVQYIGRETPRGGFVAPTSCPQWRRELNAGHYDYVITTRDRIEKGKPPYPETTKWTQAPQSKEVLRKPPTVVFALKGPLDPSACR